MELLTNEIAAGSEPWRWRRWYDIGLGALDLADEIASEFVVAMDGTDGTKRNSNCLR